MSVSPPAQANSTPFFPAETSCPGAAEVRLSVYSAAKMRNTVPSISAVATGQGCRPQICFTISRGVLFQSIGDMDLSSILV